MGSSPGPDNRTDLCAKADLRFLPNLISAFFYCQGNYYGDLMSESIPKDTITRIRQEVILAEKLNQNELEPIIRENLNRYCSRHAPENASVQDYDLILNEVYPIVQRELPAIFFRNPRVFLKPRNKTFIAKRRNPLTGVMEDKELDSQKSAKTQEAILNYKLEEIRYKKETQKCLLDALLFPHGILWHGYKGNFGMTAEKSLWIEDDDIFVQRLNPLKFLKDPSTPMSRLEEANWVGRSFEVRLDDLVNDDTLDVDKKQIKGELGYGQVMEDGKAKHNGGQDKIQIGRTLRPLSEFLEKDYKNTSLARWVTCYEILIRPTMKERREGKKGYILVYTKEQNRSLRENGWQYKAKGWPGIPLSFNPLNDNMFGVSDPEIWGSIADQKNKMVNLLMRNVQENSRVIIGLDKDKLSNEEDMDKIRQGDQSLITFNGNPSETLKILSPSGLAINDVLQGIAQTQKNLEDKSGITELGMGRLQSGEESAASVEIRSQNMSARPAYRQDIMSDFISDSVHYLNQLIKQYYPVDKAVRIVGSLDVEWSDDPTREEIQAETDVEIDVLSMLPENPDKEIQEMQTVLNLMYQALTTPPIMQKIQQEGMTMNVSPIIEQLLIRLKIKNPDVFRRTKPEESQGFASVSELRAAGENVKQALAGQQPSDPPQAGQDHAARMEMYQEFASLLQELGDTPALRTLQQLMMAQQSVAEEESKQKPNVGQKVDKIAKPKSKMGLAHQGGVAS